MSGVVTATPMIFRAVRRRAHEDLVPLVVSALHLGVVAITCWVLLAGDWIRRQRTWKGGDFLVCWTSEAGSLPVRRAIQGGS